MIYIILIFFYFSPDPNTLQMIELYIYGNSGYIDILAPHKCRYIGSYAKDLYAQYYIGLYAYYKGGIVLGWVFFSSGYTWHRTMLFITL